MNQRERGFLWGGLVILFALSLGYFVHDNYQAGDRWPNLALNTLLLAVPLALLYFSIWLMVEAVMQHNEGGLDGQTARLLYYTPRISGLVIAVFTGLFALDALDIEGSLLEKIGGFFIEAAPAIVMAVVVAVTWRWAWVGALVFGLAALFFMRFVLTGAEFGFGNLLLFVLPMAAVAGLFWMNWLWRGPDKKIPVG